MIYFWSVIGILLIIIIVALILALWTDTTVCVKYINGDLNLKIKNIFYVYNYPSKKKTTQANSLDDNEQNLTSEAEEKSENKNKKWSDSLKNLSELKNITALIKDIIRLMKYKLKFKKLEIKVDYGSGDAANTGIACGAFWTSYGIILPILVNYFYLEKPIVRFEPCFNNKIYDIKFESIIKVKGGHIINTLIISGINYFKRKLKNK